MRFSSICACTALLLLSTSAFAQPSNVPGHASPKPNTNHEAVSATEDSVGAVVGTVSAEMTSTTKGFVTAAAISDMYEVAAAKVALERSQSAAIKEFATQMVAAHTKTTATLKGILKTNKVKVTPPAHVDSRRQGMLDNLRGAKAIDFDHRYAVQQVAAHKEADILFTGYAKDGDNAPIREFAGKTDGDIKMHLSMAQGLDPKK